MTIELGPGRNGDSEPEAVTPGRGGGRVRQVASRKHRMIVLGIELNALARLLRDRRFQRNVITGMIGLAALVRLMRESQEHSFKRLTAWDQKQRLRRQRRAGARPA